MPAVSLVFTVPVHDQPDACGGRRACASLPYTRFPSRERWALDLGTLNLAWKPHQDGTASKNHAACRHAKDLCPHPPSHVTAFSRHEEPPSSALKTAAL